MKKELSKETKEIIDGAIQEMQKQTVYSIKNGIETSKVENSNEKSLKRREFEKTLLREDVVEFFEEKSPEEINNFFGEEVLKMIGYNQNNPHHCYDLFGHVLHTVKQIETNGLNQNDIIKLKVAAFFHDIGKPEVAKIKGDKTVFYNHAKKSGEMAQSVLDSLGYTQEEIAELIFYIEHHDDFISFKSQDDIKNIGTEINAQTIAKSIQNSKENALRVGGYNPSKEDYARLLKLCRADAEAQSENAMSNGKVIDTKANKVRRVDDIEKQLSEAYSIAIRNIFQKIECITEGSDEIKKTAKEQINSLKQGSSSKTIIKVRINGSLSKYEKELRKVNFGTNLKGAKSKIVELYNRGATQEQIYELCRVMGQENGNMIIGIMDEVYNKKDKTTPEKSSIQPPQESEDVKLIKD